MGASNSGILNKAGIYVLRVLPRMSKDISFVQGIIRLFAPGLSRKTFDSGRKCNEPSFPVA
jgi:hypothetical protein